MEQKKTIASTDTILKYQQQAANASKTLYNNRFGPNLVRITLSYMAIIVGGISIFYLAKKEIGNSRQEAMNVKREIFLEPNDKYPNRFEIIKAEKQNNSDKQLYKWLKSIYFDKKKTVSLMVWVKASTFFFIFKILCVYSIGLQIKC